MVTATDPVRPSHDRLTVRQVTEMLNAKLNEGITDPELKLALGEETVRLRITRDRVVPFSRIGNVLTISSDDAAILIEKEIAGQNRGGERIIRRNQKLEAASA